MCKYMGTGTKKLIKSYCKKKRILSIRRLKITIDFMAWPNLTPYEFFPNDTRPLKPDFLDLSLLKQNQCYRFNKLCTSYRQNLTSLIWKTEEAHEALYVHVNLKPYKSLEELKVFRKTRAYFDSKSYHHYYRLPNGPQRNHLLLKIRQYSYLMDACQYQFLDKVLLLKNKKLNVEWFYLDYPLPPYRPTVFEKQWYDL